MLSQVDESNEMIAKLNQKVEEAATTDPYEILGVSPPVEIIGIARNCGFELRFLAILISFLVAP